jgi:hypothetical protein
MNNTKEKQIIVTINHQKAEQGNLHLRRTLPTT